MITVTGNRDAVAGEMFDVMGDGTIVCNAGHFDIEVNKTDLESRASSAQRCALWSNASRWTTAAGSTCSQRAAW